MRAYRSATVSVNWYNEYCSPELEKLAHANLLYVIKKQYVGRTALTAISVAAKAHLPQLCSLPLEMYNTELSCCRIAWCPIRRLNVIWKAWLTLWRPMRYVPIQSLSEILLQCNLQLKQSNFRSRSNALNEVIHLITGGWCCEQYG